MKIRWVIILGMIVVTGLSFICLASLTIIMGHAQSEMGVPVSYIKEESDAYALSVEVRGDGEIHYKDVSGGEVLRRSQKEYLLKVDEEASVEIIPQKGNGIKSITLDDKEIKSNIKNNIVTIRGQEKPQHLLVVFNTNESGARTGIEGLIEKKELRIALVLLCIGIVTLWGKRKMFRN